MVNAVYTDDDGTLSMIEFDGLVFPVYRENRTIKPAGPVKSIQEITRGNSSIEVFQDDIGFIISVRFDNNTVYEIRRERQ